MNKRQKKKTQKKLYQKNQSLEDFVPTIELLDFTGHTIRATISGGPLGREKLDMICGIESRNTSYAVVAKSLKSQKLKGIRRKRILLRRRMR